VSTRPESWSRPAEPARSALAALLAAAAFFAAWATIHHGFYTRDQIPDTPVYQRYGDAIARGEVPYRDFLVEYPPAALPAFVLPSLVAPEGDLESYERVFQALMAASGAAVACLVALVLVRDGAGTARLAGGIALAALAPLALGSVVLSRFDLWPAALTVAAVAALYFGRDRLAFGVLGLAIAAKVYPVVLVPIMVAYVWKRRGRRRALVSLGICAAVAAACVIPFLVLAPGGVWDSIVRQVTRPLQIESLGASLLLAAHHAFGLGITMRSGHGSQNLAGVAPNVLGAIQTALQIAALLAVWVWFARGPAERGRLLRAIALAVCVFVALGKVLSPQFLVWLVPLVVLVRGRRGLAAGGVLLVALVVTQVWFPFRYWDLALSFDEAASWLVLARDLVLLGLLAVLVWPARPSAITPK
jgi:uncharacterized membrane protein